MTLGGAIAKWSKVLVLIEKINESQKIPDLPSPWPEQTLKKTGHESQGAFKDIICLPSYSCALAFMTCLCNARTMIFIKLASVIFDRYQL